MFESSSYQDSTSKKNRVNAGPSTCRNKLVGNQLTCRQSTSVTVSRKSFGTVEHRTRKRLPDGCEHDPCHGQQTDYTRMIACLVFEKTHWSQALAHMAVLPAVRGATLDPSSRIRCIRQTLFQLETVSCHQSSDPRLLRGYVEDQTHSKPRRC